MADTDTVARHTAQAVQSAVVRTGMFGMDQVMVCHMYMVAAAHMALLGTGPEQGKAVARKCKGRGRGMACNRALGTGVVHATRLSLSQVIAQE